MSDNSFIALHPELTWSEDGMPRSSEFDDIYYSRTNAQDESKHVFIAGTGLNQLWSQNKPGPKHTVVAELGFGGGLNFLNTWIEWRNQRATPHADFSLHYVALENHPLSKAQLADLYQHWPALKPYSGKLLSAYRPGHKGLIRLRLETDVCLDLVIGDAHSCLAKRSLSDPKVDAWFLDGFSPAKNPELWNAELFELLATHSHALTQIATYSSAGFVRRNLVQAGFEVERAKGYGNKRHMLKAFNPSPRARLRSSTPWFQINSVKPKEKHAAVIGAGLAGCFTAHALARRGWRVELLDSGASIASGASGIAQLALRCRLFNKANTPARFYLQAYSYAQSLLVHMNDLHEQCFYPTGLLQQTGALNKQSELRAADITGLYPADIVRLDSNGDYWFPDGGWVDSNALCKGITNPGGINFLPNSKIQSLQRSDGCWQLIDTEQNTICEASTVVLANGVASAAYQQTQNIPLQTSYGQSSQFSGTKLSSLSHVLCGDKSFFPEHGGMHTVSASYRQSRHSTSLCSEDDVKNQRSLEAALDLPSDGVVLEQSQIGARCHSRDRIPVVGPVPDFTTMLGDFAGLADNAKAEINKQASYLEGLYINTGHGSNGLASCPLSGEYLASLMCGECSPLDSEIMQLLHPARFLIQDLKKQRI